MVPKVMYRVGKSFLFLFDLRPHGLCSPWNSPGQNTGVGSLSLLQGIFPQESNQGLLHCRKILYQLSYLLERSAELGMETGERKTYTVPPPPHNRSYQSSSKGSLNRQHYPSDNKLLTQLMSFVGKCIRRQVYPEASSSLNHL